MRDSPFPASSSTFRTAVLPHARPVCALNAATALERRVCKRRPGLHFSPNQNPRNSIRPALPIRNPQRPSGADSNPIGRSPRPSQTPATYFKRPYRNCPGRDNCARSRLNQRGSPDRDLTFPITDHDHSRFYSRLRCRLHGPQQQGTVGTLICGRFKTVRPGPPVTCHRNGNRQQTPAVSKNSPFSSITS